MRHPVCSKCIIKEAIEGKERLRRNVEILSTNAFLSTEHYPEDDPRQNRSERPRALLVSCGSLQGLHEETSGGGGGSIVPPFARDSIA
jgi:hypothetical protein